MYATARASPGVPAPRPSMLSAARTDTSAMMPSAVISAPGSEVHAGSPSAATMSRANAECRDMMTGLGRGAEW